MHTSERIAGLDGIRALAVSAVVWHHTHPGYPSFPASINGFLGVDVFFVLSGFLITWLLIRESKLSGSISLKRFYIRRSLRIFPLYYLVIGFVACYYFATGDSSFLEELPFHATYTSNWTETSSMMAITWSLSTEEQFYLVWPALLVLLGPWSVLAIILFLPLNQAVNFGLLDEQLAAIGLPYGQYSILQSTFTPIILGVLLAFVLASRMRDALARYVWLWLPVAIVALVAAANHPGDMRGWPRLAFHFATAAVLAGIVLRPQHLLVRCLEWKPLVYVGTVSYGVYLLHKLAMGVVVKVGVPTTIAEVYFIASLTASILAAGISYRYFERPLLQLKDRFRGNYGERSVAAPSVAGEHV